MNGDQLNEKISDHGYRIQSLEENTSRVISSIDKLTDAMNNQATQFAVFAAKHDTVSAELDSVRKEIKLHAEILAAHKPVIDGVRGLFWKIISATITGGFGLAAIVVAIYKGAVQ